MKKFISGSLITCSLLFFAGCFKDSCISTYKIYIPVYKSLTEVRNDMKGLPAQPLEQTGKIYVYKNYLFINEVNKGIHVINNSNPASPVNLYFVAVPGNVDIAVKDNFLYADSYSDLVVFDISDVTNIHTVQFVNNVFPDRNMYYNSSQSNPDSAQVIVDYLEKDTTVSCDVYNNWVYYNYCPYCESTVPSVLTSVPSPSNTGTGGSAARFTILNDYLYTISTATLSGFDLANTSHPQIKFTSDLNGTEETIYPFEDKLFIGSSNGMYMYDVSVPSSPAALGQFAHVTTCDPVIADKDYAYVTLHSGNQCNGFTNQLEVLDISDLLNPVSVKTYAMTSPYGLSKDNNWLFICDGKDGLKVYDATNPLSLGFKKQISGFEPHDVITANSNAIVVAADGLYQFDYSDINNIYQVSKLSILKK